MKPVVYRQNDPDWGLEDTGESQESLGSVGCLVTSLTMAYNWLHQPEVPLTPKDMNDWLKENPDAFIGANMVIQTAAEHVTLSALNSVRVRGSPGDQKLVNAVRDTLRKKDAEGKQTHVAVLHVSTDGGPKGRHFVLGRVLDGDIVQVDDPALGKTIDMPLATLSVTVYWRKKPKLYRVVGVVPVSL